MGCHAILLVTKCLPPLPLPREVEDFLRSGKYIADSLPTEMYHLVDFIYVLGTSTEYNINLSLVLNSLYY